MSNRLRRAAGSARSRFSLEAFEARVLMDATYQYLGADHVLNLPTDRLGGAGAAAQIVVLDDIDADGVRDLAASGQKQFKDQYDNTYNAGIVRIFSGKSGALLRELSNSEQLYDTSFGYRMTLGPDLDSDGLRDLVVSDAYAYSNNVPGTVRVYSPRTGVQVAAFGTGLYYSVGAINSPGDLDGDNQDDLVITGTFPNQVGGRTVTTRAYSARTGTIIWEAAVGDVNDQYGANNPSGLVSVGDYNGDGKPDLLVGGDDSNIGDNFTTSKGFVSLVSGLDGSVLRTWQPGDISTGFGNRIAYLGDVDNSNVGDFAVISYTLGSLNGADTIIGTLEVHSLDNADLSVNIWSKDLGAWIKDSGVSNIGFANVGDFNNDGIADLGVMIGPDSRTSFVRIYSGADGSTLRDATTTAARPGHDRTTGTIFFGMDIAGADLDNDGFPELLVGTQQAESPREGQTTPNPFLAVIPLIQFQTPVITHISAAGIASGTIGGKPFFAVNNIVTPVAGFRGLLAGDRIFDYNNQGLALGSPNADGTDAFLLENGVRTLLSTLPKVDRLSTTGEFTTKPAGVYASPTAFRLAAGAKAGLVVIMRDVTSPTTWLLRKNSTDSGYELVYLFDGNPAGISFNADTAAAVKLDGVSTFLAGGLTTATPQLYSVDDFIASVVGSASIGGYSANGHDAKVGYIDSSTSLPSFGFGVLKSDSVSITATFKIIGIASTVVPTVLTFEPAAGSDRVKVWTRDGAGAWTSQAIDADSLTGLPEPATSFVQTPMSFSPSGSIFSVDSLNAAPASAARYVPNSADGPYFFDSVKPLANSPVGESGAAIVGFNAFGELIYLRRNAETDDWTAQVLVIPAGATVYDAAVWNNGVAVATSAGLIRLIRAADGTWDSLNLTTDIGNGATGVGRSLHAITSLNGYIVLTGLNADNQVVIYGSNDANPDKDTAWSYDNLSLTVPGPDDGPVPAFQGDLVTYVTPWNGLNIAGLVSGTGEPATIWTAPGITGWRYSNLAEAQEDPVVAQGFTRLVVNITPWGGISLTDSDSALRTVWWAPALGGTWKFAALADVVSNAPRPQLVESSVVAFATTWGGQNIAGTDADGHLWVYWWSPESNKWVADSLQDAVGDLDGRTFAPRLAAYATSGNVPMGVTAIDSNAHALHMYFKIGTGWLVTDATAAVDQSL